MSFPGLEPYKRQDAEVASLLSQIEVYLESILRKPPIEPDSFYDYPGHDIRPSEVAYNLEVSVTKAHVLLSFFVQAKILQPRYDIYCPDSEDFIESVNNVSDLPRNIDCPFHEDETSHEIDEYKVNIVYQFSSQIVSANALAIV